jgi:hypothetical protein
MADGPTAQAEVGATRNTLRQFGVDGAERRSDAQTHGDVYAGLHGATDCAFFTSPEGDVPRGDS